MSSSSANDSSPFGVPRDFRKTHGEEEFRGLCRMVFAESDNDSSGSIDKSELRTTLKKLGVRLTGATAAILEHYDTDKNGVISEDEFLHMVSDLMDGTFEQTLKPALEAKVAAQQQKQQIEMQAAALQQHAQVQQQLVDEITRLRAELVSERTASAKLREQVKTLKKQVNRVKDEEDAAAEKKAKEEKKAREDAMVREADARLMEKLNAAPVARGKKGKK